MQLFKALFFAISMTVFGSVAAGAATIVVTTASDPATGTASNCPGTSCSLRDAIVAGADGDTITFGVPGPINVASTLTINRQAGTLTIDGGSEKVSLVKGGSAGSTFPLMALVGGANFVTNIDNLTFENGNAVYGGAIYIGVQIVNITSSTFLNNSATYGGAIDVAGSGTLRVINSTFSGNSSSIYGGALAFIRQFGANSGFLYVTNCTFSNNASSYAGGDIANYTGVPVVLTNTILANHPTASAPNCYGTITDGGGNLSDDASCGTIPVSTTLDASLQPLADNGGLEQTLALLAGSPAASLAVSTCPNTVDGTCPTTDERGVPRPATGFSSGAFQTIAPLAITCPVGNGRTRTAYGDVVSATGGAEPYTFTAVSGLPAGLALASDGTLSGAPTDAGSFTAVIQVTSAIPPTADTNPADISATASCSFNIIPTPANSCDSMGDSGIGLGEDILLLMGFLFVVRWRPRKVEARTR